MSTLDHNNPAPQIEAHGRIYRANVVVDFYLPEGIAAPEGQIHEWLLWEMQLAGQTRESPLHDQVLSVHRADITDLRDMKCRAFTEWEGLSTEGRRSGRSRIVRDGEAYNPAWVEPEA
ncbi:hypothetical protein [Sandarakinorhabdus sp.]|uniref:hypothetical protein n=1 Tax=Sandarakinorhabdus sp. TaxID=1916663 RepID=UPI00286E016C|nr:hypothetical protein [Sandarakinorhabdus sp.]